ncbi:MAG: InlB B-repeat-containing protein [Mycoplasmataceae bacterium]|nr:InlB B-repeat-containing protein [Mycoplasmataceae bacterium]
MMKKIFLSLFLLIFSLCLVGCRDETVKTYYDEYFTYSKKEYLNDGTIYLTGLTEMGKEQEVLYIPSEYKGNKVKLSNNSIISNLLIIESDKLKKIYIDEGITECGNLSVVNNSVEIIILSSNVTSKPDRGQVYVTSEVYEKINSKFIMPANISFRWNYEGAPNNGYFWIDDYNNELINYIPIEPVRDGYVFDGWYKESTCINKWDFSVDVIPEKEYNSDYEYIFYETVLYAKWIKE